MTERAILAVALAGARSSVSRGERFHIEAAPLPGREWMTERVWIVTDFDFGNSLRIVAAYPTEPLAKEHVALMGGYVDEQELRHALHADATDPAKQQERAAEQDAARKAYLSDRAAFENERQKEIMRDLREP